MRFGLPARPGPGTDARGAQSSRPILKVLALFVIVFVAIYGPMFFASSQTRSGVRLAVQEKCGLSSAAVAGELTIDVGTAEVPYVDSTGAHTAIVYIGARQTYFVHTCGR
jgi:hypothetical protein